MNEQPQNEMHKILSHLVPTLVKVLKGFIKVLRLVANRINPKYWHYYIHSKKRRIREKYRNRILREVFAAA